MSEAMTTAPVTQSHVGRVCTLRTLSEGIVRGKIMALTNKGIIVDVIINPWTKHQRVERRLLVGAEIVED